MKTKILMLIGFLLTREVFAALELVGVIEVSSGSPLFMLYDWSRSRTSDWLPLNRAFGDYELIRYDNQGEILVVKRGSNESLLKLRSTIVTDGHSNFTAGRFYLGSKGLSAIPTQFQFNYDQLSQFELEGGRILTILPKLQENDKYAFFVTVFKRQSSGELTQLARAKMVMRNTYSANWKLAEEWIFYFVPD